jgi:hypothetical protein
MYKWKDKAKCLGMDTNIFFDKYEQDPAMAASIDALCQQCPVNKECFAVGVSNKEYGVWGGVYLDAGKISREFNRHKSKADWANTWQNLTIEQE